MAKAIKDKFTPLTSSFRDPSGFLFNYQEKLLRTISPSYQIHYDYLFSSRLFDDLVADKMLVPHEDVTDSFKKNFSFDIYKVIEPVQIPFVSYPYEWCFSMLKDAALLTLAIQKHALSKNMILKDATPYNIQFYNGKPILIDTLSFEKYEEGTPWIAYRQFCEMFLAPLSLAYFVDERMISDLRVYLDGFPLDLVTKILPHRAKLSFPLLLHIFFHARSQKSAKDTIVSKKKVRLSKSGLLGIIENLESAIKNFKLSPKKTVWRDYYQETNYSSEAMEAKKRIVSEFLKNTRAKSVWDLGSNTGEFSLISSALGIETVAMDFDYGAVENLYENIKLAKIENILPIRLDLSNPSPSLGWANRERESLTERGSADTLLALALIHHLAIAHNLSFDLIASYFQSLCSYLIIEFVPKSDSQTKRLLATREDIFPSYTQELFEEVFGKYFQILKKELIKDSMRTLYLMKKR